LIWSQRRRYLHRANGIYVATPGVQGAVINETVGAELGIVDIVFIDAPVPQQEM